MTEGLKFIVHVVNDSNGWGRGFVTALSSRWSAPEAAYRRWVRSSEFTLGTIQMVPVESDVAVINVLAQHGYRSAKNPTPLDYDALDRALGSTADLAVRLGASIHAPRLGAGLAGGSWAQIEALLIKHFIDRNLSVTIYDLPTT